MISVPSVAFSFMKLINEKVIIEIRPQPKVKGSLMKDRVLIKEFSTVYYHWTIGIGNEEQGPYQKVHVTECFSCNIILNYEIE